MSKAISVLRCTQRIFTQILFLIFLFAVVKRFYALLHHSFVVHLLGVKKWSKPRPIQCYDEMCWFLVDRHTLHRVIGKGENGW